MDPTRQPADLCDLGLGLLHRDRRAGRRRVGRLPPSPAADHRALRFPLLRLRLHAKTDVAGPGEWPANLPTRRTRGGTARTRRADVFGGLITTSRRWPDISARWDGNSIEPQRQGSLVESTRTTCGRSVVRRVAGSEAICPDRNRCLRSEDAHVSGCTTKYRETRPTHWRFDVQNEQRYLHRK
jgi:hypothetical protein